MPKETSNSFVYNSNLADYNYCYNLNTLKNDEILKLITCFLIQYNVGRKDLSYLFAAAHFSKHFQRILSYFFKEVIFPPLISKFFVQLMNHSKYYYLSFS